MDGGNGFRARFGVERNGQTLAGRGLISARFGDQGRLSRIHCGRSEEAGLGQGSYCRKSSRPLRKLPALQTKLMRCRGRRIFPAASSVWRSNTAARLTATPRRARLPGICRIQSPSIENRFTLRESISLPKYPTLPDAKQFRLPNIGFSVQKAAIDQGIAKHFPLIVCSGRLVEFEGGGEETRSNKWLAELQQDMFIEINPADAAERGIKDGGWVWVTGAENSAKAKMKALVTERVGKGVAWMPFHFGGWFGGVDLRDRYPKGADPYVLGESANTIMTYGYDPATGMQEPKVSLCQIRAA